MINDLKIYISDSLNPYKNLAIEKCLLESADNCLILYLWQNENTVVIGRNQNPWSECNTSLLEKENINLARRLSGGGAVFHDKGNLNFTFLCQSEDYNLSRQLEVIKKACEMAGVNTVLSGRNDILADGRKFSGNAFYNSKGKSYHHGTLLISADLDKASRYLTPSKAKLEAKGVKSVSSRIVNLSELVPTLTVKMMQEYMISSFSEVYSMTPTLIKSIDYKAVEAYNEEFENWDFIYGKSAPFTVSCEGYFTWGHAELNLNVTGAVIDSAKFYTDSMDHEISKRVEEALINTRFDIKSIEKSLFSSVGALIAADIEALLQKQVL